MVGLGVYSRINNAPLNKYSFRQVSQSIAPNFNSNLDGVFAVAPIGVCYGLHFTGLKQRSDFINKSIILLKSNLLMSGIVYSGKYLIGDARPNGVEFDAFPSGTTARAFVAAQFLYKEYGKEYPWVGVLGYTFATATAIFRMLNDDHWSADVLAGAGIGILSVNLVYLTHRYKFGKKPTNTLVY